VTGEHDVQYIAVIADIVHSRRIVGADRHDLQRRVERALTKLNRRFAKSLAATFVITVGDEFQGLLRTGREVPDIIRQLETALPEVDIRLGFGRGSLDTTLRKAAIGMDGPVWHAARQAIGLAKDGRRLGGVFLGFEEKDGPTLNGLARILHHVRSRLTPKQRNILEELLMSGTQKDMAKRAGVTQQAISKQARAAGLDAYREAEDAFRAVLERNSPQRRGDK
jgi:hypothetical protein